MQSLIRRSPLCRRYPRSDRAFELGFVLPVFLSLIALARIAGVV